VVVFHTLFLKSPSLLHLIALVTHCVLSTTLVVLVVVHILTVIVLIVSIGLSVGVRVMLRVWVHVHGRLILIDGAMEIWLVLVLIVKILVHCTESLESSLVLLLWLSILGIVSLIQLLGLGLWNLK